MPAAARIGDLTAHGGAIGTPPPNAVAVVPTVLIGGRPAAVAGCAHVCVIPPHAALPVNVVLPDLAAAVTGDVLIGGLRAVRMRDRTTCGAMVSSGAFNVMIGGPV